MPAEWVRAMTTMTDVSDGQYGLQAADVPSYWLLDPEEPCWSYGMAATPRSRRDAAATSSRWNGRSPPEWPGRARQGVVGRVLHDSGHDRCVLRVVGRWHGRGVRHRGEHRLDRRLIWADERRRVRRLREPVEELLAAPDRRRQVRAQQQLGVQRAQRREDPGEGRPVDAVPTTSITTRGCTPRASSRLTQE